MKKTASSIFEFAGFICSLIGIIGLLGSAGKIIYRERPSMSFVIEDYEIHNTANTERNRRLFAQLVNITLDYLSHKDLDAANGFTQIIQEDPGYIQGYYFRGLIYLAAGYVEAGIIDMQIVTKQSDDPALRQQARQEIALARIAQVLTPILFLGLAGAAGLFIANWAGMNVSSWGRSARIFLIAAFILWIISFIFLLFH